MTPGAFRFFLASLVVVSHYSSIGIGKAAVFLFFTLSGFWVYKMWVIKYSFTKMPYATYIISRIWRLAPVFLLCSGCALLISFILPYFVRPVVPFEPLNIDVLVSSVFLLGYNTLKNPLLVPAWSLDLELQFYLIAPAIIFMVNKAESLTVLAIGGLGLVGLVTWGDKTLLPYLPFFLVGIVAAKDEKIKINAKAKTISWLLVFIVLLVFSMMPMLKPMLFGGARQGPLFVYNTPLNVLLAILALPFAINTLSQSSFKFDRLLSDASYPLYLFHWIPLLVLGHYFPWVARSELSERIFWTSIGLIATYSIAIAITIWVDQPINKKRSRFVGKRLLIQRKIH